jgi:hypothetical protein
MLGQALAGSSVVKFISRIFFLIFLELFVASNAIAYSCTQYISLDTRSKLASFKIHPDGLLKRFANGGPALSSELSLIISADPEGTQRFTFEILRSANIYQKKAIGKGLGLAVNICQRNGRSDYAYEFRRLLRQYSEMEAMSEFENAINIRLKPSTPPNLSAAQDGGRLMGRIQIRDPKTNVFRSQEILNPGAH